MHASRRISVVGNAGSGKTTLSRALAARLGVPCLELDSLFHQPRWTPLPRSEFRARVAVVVAGDGWVVDGNYAAVQDLVWARADLVVWLDLPRPLIMRRVVWRTFSRGLLRRELWNGNRESLRSMLRLDPQASIIRWAWVEHANYQKRYAEAAGQAGPRFVRLRSAADVAALLDAVASTPPPATC